MMKPKLTIADRCRFVAALDALQAEVDALKGLQAETAAELDAPLPAILPPAPGFGGPGDCIFKGES